MHNCIVHFWPDWSQIITMQIPGTYKGTNSTHTCMMKDSMAFNHDYYHCHQFLGSPFFFYFVALAWNMTSIFLKRLLRLNVKARVGPFCLKLFICQKVTLVLRVKLQTIFLELVSFQICFQKPLALTIDLLGERPNTYPLATFIHTYGLVLAIAIQSLKVPIFWYFNAVVAESAFLICK